MRRALENEGLIEEKRRLCASSIKVKRNERKDLLLDRGVVQRGKNDGRGRPVMAFALLGGLGDMFHLASIILK